jgi:hypothetical protein
MVIYDMVAAALHIGTCGAVHTTRDLPLDFSLSDVSVHMEHSICGNATMTSYCGLSPKGAVMQLLGACLVVLPA